MRQSLGLSSIATQVAIVLKESCHYMFTLSANIRLLNCFLQEHSRIIENPSPEAQFGSYNWRGFAAPIWATRVISNHVLPTPIKPPKLIAIWVSCSWCRPSPQPILTMSVRGERLTGLFYEINYFSCALIEELRSF